MACQRFEVLHDGAEVELVARAGGAAQAHAFETMMSLQVRKAHLDLVTLIAEFLAGRPDKREYSCQLGSHPGNAGSVDFTV
jgi:hypothetical protein